MVFSTFFGVICKETRFVSIFSIYGLLGVMLECFVVIFIRRDFSGGHD